MTKKKKPKARRRAQRRPRSTPRKKNPTRKERARRRAVRKAVKKVARIFRKKNQNPKRAGLVGAKRVRRNITPFLQGALWGAGYSAFEGTRHALKGKKAKKPVHRKKKQARKPRRNPEGMTAVAVGRGSRKAVIAGPAGYINTLTRDLREALGSSAVTTGKLVRQ